MEFTPEQKKKLKNLKKDYVKRGIILGFRSIGLLIIADMLIIIWNAADVHSQAFVFVGSGMNAFFIFSYLGRNMRKEYDRIEVEVKNILDN